MRRLRLGAPGLGAFSYLVGQDVMLEVPASGDLTFRRRYTIRSFDVSTETLDIDVVLHGDGPGATWARAAQVGDHVEGVGPRGKIVLTEAPWHLFLGDESAIPVTLAMIESLPSGTSALGALEVHDRAEEQVLLTPPRATVDLRWFKRDGAAAGDPELLTHALESIELPTGSGHVYLNGELGVARTLRAALLERGVTAEQISMKPYWRKGVANAAHGEPDRD
jgi:NADPH-dependent ferric siderophore reductase